MSIKLTDNIMGRPMTPGGQSDGTERVTQAFGNATEQQANLPSVNDAWGGVANRAAGVEGASFAKAAETIGSAALDTATYFDNLRTAEESSRANRMFLELDKTEAEVRSKLDADPEYGKKATAEQQQIYETERDIAFDGVKQNYGFSQKKVVQHVDDSLAQAKAQYSNQYLEKVVKPRVIQNAMVNDQASDDIVIGKVVAEPTATNIRTSTENISERYDSPQAYATYGAQGAWKLKAEALKKLTDAVMQSSSAELDTSPLNNLPAGKLITEEEVKSGSVAALVNDQKAVFSERIRQLPISDQEKQIMQMKYDKYVDQTAIASVKSHNTQVKQEHQEKMERVKDITDTFYNQLAQGARNGQISVKQIWSEYRKISESPEFKDDPQAERKLFNEAVRVEGDVVQYQRHQQTLRSEAQTRQTIAQLRMDNGVAVSGGALDGVWKKNGNLATFFKNNNVLTTAHLQEIDKAGAVPTSVLGSIQSDLRSSNPNEQKRGIQNMLAIKNASAKSQSALYRDLPDDFAGVIQRIENGQTPAEALSFLTRSKNTPDVEKKLYTQATDTKVGIPAMTETMKKAGLDPENMNGVMKDEATGMWKDAYARAGGDVKLAADLFHQDLSKNRTWGKSPISGKIEKYPLTNFTGSAEIAKALIYDAFPDTKGKDVLPVYNGMKTVNGVATPTYDVYVKDENGILTPVTNNSKQFYVTKNDVSTKITSIKLAEAEAIKKKQDYIDNSRWNGGKGNPQEWKDRPK